MAGSFTDLLNNATAIHLRRKGQDVVSHLVGQNLLLRLVAVFEEFLYDVIPKHVGHQLYGISRKFSEDLIFLIAVGSLKLLLDKSRAMLITTELYNVAIYVLVIISAIS